MGSSHEIARVLLVDHDEAARRAVHRALAQVHTSIELTECDTAEAAMRAAADGSFACALLDDQLPGVSAIELLPRLLPQLRGAPVVVLTGHGNEEVAVELMKAGASDYLSKERLDGRRLARAIAQARSLAETRRRLEGAELAQRVYLARLRRLVEVTPEFFGAPTVEARTRSVLQATQVLFAAEQVFLGLFDLDPTFLRVTRGDAVEPLGEGAADRPWHEIYAAVRKSNDRRLHVTKASTDGGLYQALPLLNGARVSIGVLAMRVQPPEPPFAELTESLFAQLRDMVAVAVDNACLYEARERAVAARDDIIAVVSHDLRSPLNSFRLGTELLRDADPTKAPVIERMLRAADHMNRLIDDLLDVSRIERGELRVTPGPRALAPLLDELNVLFAPQARLAGVALQVASVAGLRVVADGHRVLQVLSNLVSNGLKFCKRDGEVRVDAVEAGAFVEITVSDTGAGIAPEQLPRIFDRYYRQGGKGLGLGLYLARAIVHAHGGRIWADARSGDGACFRFTLPTASAQP